jgi:hypothetical protein
MWMHIRWPLFVTVFSLAVVYVAYPYFTLYRLGSAIRTADAATLESLVNWPAVREGIKEDVCDLVVDTPAQQPEARVQKTVGELPPFGSSFMRGIASSAIDQAVTPQALLAATLPTSRPQPRGADVHINWAFFDSPTSFQVSLQAPGQTEPVKLELDLKGGEWRVQRVWLPAEMLQPGSRT